MFTRESLAIEVGQGLKGEDVVGALNQIRQKRKTPKLLFCDNGSEFTSQIMDLWAYHNRVQIDFSRPGKPNACGVVQRNLARGVFGCALVRDIGRGQASHRVMEAGIQ
jgi:transposase InsO family protein